MGESVRPKKIVVTGGSGFIGTRLVTELLAEGHAVYIFDKQLSERYPNICTVGDVRDRRALTQALAGVDVVYHLAAEHRDDVRPVSLYYDVNVKGAENLVAACVENRVPQIVFTSSVAIYGLKAGEPTEESPADPFNDYSRSKFQSEAVFRQWLAPDPSRSLVMVRPVAIFGEKNRGNIYNLLNQIHSGKFMMVGDGQNRKSIGYVGNIARFLSFIRRCEAGCYIYNYADKPDLTTWELVDIALKAFGNNGNGQRPLIRLPYAVGLMGGYLFDGLSLVTRRTFPVSSIRIKKFVAQTTVSSEKMRQTGFVPSFSLAEGLRRMIASEF